MESIKQIFRIGHGPSSSHTMGPKRAAEMFLAKNTQARSFQVTFYGSLAATGKEHLTDKSYFAGFGTTRSNQIALGTSYPSTISP